jgi:hypothetical protein
LIWSLLSHAKVDPDLLYVLCCFERFVFLERVRCCGDLATEVCNGRKIPTLLSPSMARIITDKLTE